MSSLWLGITEYILKRIYHNFPTSLFRLISSLNSVEYEIGFRLEGFFFTVFFFSFFFFKIIHLLPKLNRLHLRPCFFVMCLIDGSCANNMSIIIPHECKVASTDKSYSEHVLWTYPTPSPTNQALYLSRAVQIRLRTILSLIQSYKIGTLKKVSVDFRSQLSLFVCIALHIFFIMKAIHTNKDNFDRKWADISFKLNVHSTCS